MFSKKKTPENSVKIGPEGPNCLQPKAAALCRSQKKAARRADIFLVQDKSQGNDCEKDDINQAQRQEISRRRSMSKRNRDIYSGCKVLNLIKSVKKCLHFISIEG